MSQNMKTGQVIIFLNSETNNMNKEFIPYEQALELKELGFDEECIAVYNRFKEIENSLFGNTEHDIDAPLYQQAFRWFREKHNTTHEILRKEDKNHREFIAWVYVENDKIEVVSYWNALTYEEAELACLKKLIEVVKTK